MVRERIVVVGGGCSGTLLAKELVRQARRPLHVTVVEPRPALGRGPAYATPFPVHRLNVPAERLSGHAEEPGHFVSWLRAHPPSAPEGPFAQRSFYGRYLESLLTAALASAPPGVRFEHVQDEATDLLEDADGLSLGLASGGRVRADRVVLALGNNPPDVLARLLPDAHDSARCVRDPWSPSALDFPAPDGDVLLLGTGLTAVDVAMGLQHRGHEGRILALSRHGRLPEVHAVPARPAAPSAFDAGAPPTARGLARELRRLATATRCAGGDWRSAVDGLRPRAQELWRSLGPAERARFVRHLRPLWETHRHRMAPEIGEAVQGMIAAGSLVVAAGRVLGLEETASGVRAHIRLRGAREARPRDFRHVVDGTGPGSLHRASGRLLRTLLDRRLVTADDLGLGLSATADGRVVSPLNPGGDRLFAMGPLLRGVLWETTAVPEIRDQAEATARALLSLGDAWAFARRARPRREAARV